MEPLLNQLEIAEVLEEFGAVDGFDEIGVAESAEGAHDALRLIDGGGHHDTCSGGGGEAAVVLAVRTTAANGKQSGWSNFAIVPVVPTPAKPQSVTPTGTPEGVRLTWRANAASFRVLRKAEAWKSLFATEQARQLRTVFNSGRQPRTA